MTIPRSGRAPRAASEALTHLLFSDDGAGDHEHWRRLVATEAFTTEPAVLGHDERIRLSYTRLRAIHDSIGDPAALATNVHRLAALHEWAAPVDGGLTVIAGIHYNLFLGSLLDADPDARRDLAPLLAMRRFGTFLCTELDHGNDAAALETTATYDPAGGGFLLHTPHPGARKFMPNTSTDGGPKSAVVAARLLVDGRDEGVFLFLTDLVDERGGYAPGVKVRRLPVRAGSPVDHCLTSFHQVRLPPEALLAGEHGRLSADGVLSSRFGNRRKRFLHAIGRVTPGKLCMSAAAVGGARTALAIAFRYSRHRVVGGPGGGERVPLAALRTHQDRLLGATATAYAMTFLHRAATREWARRLPGGSAEAERLVAITKAWNTWRGREILIECRERCGAQGLLEANGFVRMTTDLEGAITAEGDNLAVWVKAAGELLFAHGDSGPPLTHPAPVDDPRALRDVLAADASRRWERAAAALRSGPAGDPLGRWNHAAGPALEALSGYAVVRAADAFLDAVDAAPDAFTRALLRDLCRLFLLERARPRCGEMLAAGLLTTDDVWAVPEAADALRVALTPHLGTLVDAFAPPPELMARFPIAVPGPDAAFVPRPAIP